MKIRVASIVSLLFLLVLPSSALADTTGTLLPTADGTYTQWTPKSGSVHYTQVDETSCNGTTDYNQTTTVGNRDSYTVSLSSIPNGSQITQIALTPCASRVSMGGTNPVMNLFYRLNGVDSADAGGYALGGTTPTVLSTTTFSSLSTIKSGSSTFEVGAVLTSGTKGARLSQMTAVVTYTLLQAPSSLGVSASSGSALLSWTDNASIEDGFTIERSTDSAHFTQINTVPADTPSYTDTPLASGLYYYRVRAYNSGGNSSYTNTASVFVP